MSRHELRRTLSFASVVVALALVAFVAACGGDDGGEDAEPAATGASAAIDPSEYSNTVDHRFVPFSVVKEMIYEGRETDPESGETIETRAESRIFPEGKVVLGVDALVIEVENYEDGELVERTLDYYAQREDGSVWYLGESVDDYEDGEVVGHEGQWLAGQNGAKPGLFMPADPKVGDTFRQEQAPGVAEDESEVVEVGVDVKTPAGSFSDCIKTKDFAPIEKTTEFKYYCPDVGLVREESEGAELNLVRFSK